MNYNLRFEIFFYGIAWFIIFYFMLTLCLTFPETTSCTSTSAPGMPPVTAGTSGQTPVRRPRPLLRALSPSSIMPMLFTEDGEDDSGSDSEIDIRGYGWIDSDSEDESSSSDDGKEQLLRNKHNGLEESKQSTFPSQRTSSYSFDWSEGDFVPQLHTFQGGNSGTTKDWPCTNDSKESDFFLAFVDNEILTYIAESTNRFYDYEFQHRRFFTPRSRFLH